MAETCKITASAGSIDTCDLPAVAVVTVSIGQRSGYQVVAAGLPGTVEVPVCADHLAKLGSSQAVPMRVGEPEA